MRSVFRLLFFMLAFVPAVPAFAQVDFREETIYFLITTRFFDGDPSNNVPNEWSSYNPDPNINPSITDPQDVTWRGDFKGLIQKLDYIKDLGFTAIWITPIVQNRSPLDYHGYHAYDFTKVDPRLESPGATFQDLINEVHARGMKIVLDIVTNHSGRFGIKNHAEMKYNRDPSRPWGQASDGSPLPDATTWEYDGMTPNPADGKIWSVADVPRLPAPWNSNQAAYNFPSTVTYVNNTDPAWYHHSGNGFAQGFDDTENLYNRALHEDTPDLNTGSTEVREYLLNAYKTFIEMGVDGFRWDTIKHMSREDVLWFLDAFKAINPDLFIFGEVAQKRHELHNVQEINPHWYTWRGAVGSSQPSGMSVLDFYAMATFHMFAKGESYSNVQAAARYDHLYSNTSHLVTFLDNHDFGPTNDWNRRYEGNAENLAAALNFMWTWRGIPSLYYGTEMQFMRGAYTDIQYGGHQRSLDETGRAYYGRVIDQAPNHIIYKHLRKLNAIRRAVPALQKGTWRWGGNGGGNGVGIVREFGDSYAVVGLAKDGTVNFNFTGIRNGTYRDAVTGHEITVSNGSMTFRVAPSSAGIYVLNGPGRIGDLGAGFFQSDASGSQGTGGGGGTTPQPAATLGFTPAAPVAGQSLTITYDGFLKTQSQVNLYWGINAWQNVTTTPMTKAGDIWTVTITVPTGATSLKMVFNNGAGTWDNNSSADYSIAVTSSGGGTTEPTPVFTMNPNPPQAGRNVTITYNGSLKSAAAVNLHWGRNGWQNVTTTAMSKVNNVWTLTMPVPAGTTMLDFVFNNGSGAWDNNGGQDYHVAVVAPTSIEESETPNAIALEQNHPNPFNPTTVIRWTMGEGRWAKLSVYDVLGREVAVLADGFFAAGTHSVRFDAATLPSGMYLYRLDADGTILVRRMLFLK